MTVHLLHCSDVENAFDDPVRIGRLASLLRERRGPATIVCDTGDTLAPGLLSMETGGEHAFPFFETVEPDFATFGNHDFDVGADALRDVVERAPQTWLATNLLDGDGGPFAADEGTRRTAIATRDGTRIGLLGVTDPDTLGGHPAAEDVTVRDPVAAAREATAALREQGVDSVVVLSHAGGADDDIAAVEGVDLVLGGHVHDVRSDAVDGTPIVHPGARGEFVAEIEGTGAGFDVTLHDVTDATVAPAVADTYRDLFERQGLGETVARIDDPIRRGRDEIYPESVVGNLVADAYRWVADADVALFNALMLRPGTPIAGEVSVGALRSLTPFDNDIHSTTLDGDELVALLGNLGGPESARLEVFAHVSGARLTWRRTGSDLELLDASIDGAAPDPGESYTVAAPAYAFFSGLFPPLSPDRLEDEHGHQHDALLGYVGEHGIDTATDGRMRAAHDSGPDDLRSLR